MQLAARRTMREAVRQGTVLGAQSEAIRVSQGVSTRDSAVAGARAQRQNRTAGNLLAVRQDRMSSERMFDFNRQITDVQRSAIDRNIGFQNQRSDISADVYRAQIGAARLGASNAVLGGQLASAQSSAAFGSSLVGLGGLFLNNATTIGNIGQSFPGLFNNTVNVGSATRAFA